MEGLPAKKPNIYKSPTYCVHFLVPHFIKDFSVLERVLRRSITWRFENLCTFPSEQRMLKWNLAGCMEALNWTSKGESILLGKWIDK